jgi:hypothetical protein
MGDTNGGPGYYGRGPQQPRGGGGPGAPPMPYPGADYASIIRGQNAGPQPQQPQPYPGADYAAIIRGQNAPPQPQPQQTGTYSSQGPPPAPRSADSVAGRPAPFGGQFSDLLQQMRNGAGAASGAPAYTPNQLLAQQYGRGSRAFYSPFNSPYAPGPIDMNGPRSMMGGYGGLNYPGGPVLDPGYGGSPYGFGSSNPYGLGTYGQRRASGGGGGGGMPK